MINIPLTIMKSIVDAFKKLSLQAKFDKAEMRTAFELAVLNDIVGWTEDLDDASLKESLLGKIREDFIRCNKHKLVIHRIPDLTYRNVNTD
jgi:hypothetical protein